MTDVTAHRVADVAAGRVTDKKGRRAPKRVLQALKNAGVVSFSCEHLDWKVVGTDAEFLLERLTAATQREQSEAPA